MSELVSHSPPGKYNKSKVILSPGRRRSGIPLISCRRSHHVANASNSECVLPNIMHCTTPVALLIPCPYRSSTTARVLGRRFQIQDTPINPGPNQPDDTQACYVGDYVQSKPRQCQYLGVLLAQNTEHHKYALSTSQYAMRKSPVLPLHLCIGTAASEKECVPMNPGLSWSIRRVAMFMTEHF